MKNLTIELVIKTISNIIKQINVGDIVRENEHIQNRIVVSGEAEVYFLKSVNGPAIPARGRSFGTSKVYFGRILLLKLPEVCLYVWAGKRQNSDEADQRIEEISIDEFNSHIGELQEERATETVATVTSAPVVEERKRSGAAAYLRRLEETRGGWLLVPNDELIPQLLPGKKKRTPGQVNEALFKLGLAGITAIPKGLQENPCSHTLLVVEGGHLEAMHYDLLTLADPIEIIARAYERDLKALPESEVVLR